MKVKMLFWKMLPAKHSHKDGMIYYCCDFEDDWICFPYIFEQEIRHKPQHRFKRLNLSRGK